MRTENVKHMINCAVILAGGKSSRFGQPKSFAVVDGRPLIEKIIDELRTSGIENIYISTDNPSLYESLGLPILIDEYKECGPLGGIHRALSQLDEDAVLFISCDMPRITSNELEKIIEHATNCDSPIVYAITSKRSHPLCGVIRKSILTDLTIRLDNGNYGVFDFFNSLDYSTVFFHDEDTFLNLNTPLDLAPEEGSHSDESFFGDVQIGKYISGKGFSEIDDPVIRESIIQIWLNDDEIAEIQALAKEVEDLALGFLYTECVINDVSAVSSIDFNEKLLSVTVTTSEKIDQFGRGLVRNVAPGCGQVVFSVAPSFKKSFEALETCYNLRASYIPVLMRELLHASFLFRTTGGVHTAALSDGERIIHVSDDIGRHNCADKIIGKCLRNEIVHPERRVMLTSGRVSTDVVLKAVRGRFPFVISHSAPSMGAIQLSKDYGVTLVGFVRGTKFNLYTHKERIVP